MDMAQVPAVLFPCRPPPNRALFADPHPVATSIVPMAWTLQIFEKNIENEYSEMTCFPADLVMAKQVFSDGSV